MMPSLTEPYTISSPQLAITCMYAELAAQSAAAPRTHTSLQHAYGRFLAEDVRADRNSPPFDYSAMDGYAVRHDSLLQHADPASVTLPVRGESVIGTQPPPLETHPSAVRISTGAALPVGADTVIKREDVQEIMSGSAVQAIEISAALCNSITVAANIRHSGDNARAGDIVLGTGTLLTASTIGTLAAVGCADPFIYERQRVTIITTGDELVPANQVPNTFQIRNSNASVLEAVFRSKAWIELLPSAHEADQPEQLRATLQRAINESDAVILTGGVSMGHRDPVRSAVDALGARVIFHGLPQRPGRPMLGAIATRNCGRRVAILALPGNPLSAMVTATRIALPLLAQCAGARGTTPSPTVRLANPDGKSIPLWWHRLVRINDQGVAELVDERGSGDIIAGGKSDGFIEIPPVNTDHTHCYHFYPWP